MSTFAYCPDCRNELFPTGLPGNSDQSKKTSLYKRSVMEKLLDIAAPIIQKTYFGKDLEVLKKLEGIFEEAFEQLDEGQEIPLRRETFKDALKFLLILPNDYPIPELEIEETGDITMEWYRDKWNIFSVMVDGSGVYYYAGLFGDEDNRDKGRKPLGIVIDEVVLKHIKRITG